jgi:hypothetical protein
MTGHAEAHQLRRLTADLDHPARAHRAALDDARTLGRIHADVWAHQARHAGIHPQHEAGCQMCVLLRDLRQHLDGGAS